MLSQPKALHIAITADPEIPVPPIEYGGIERIVDMLVRGLVMNGHHVTLFAHRDSAVPCELAAYPRTHSRGWGNVVRNALHVSSTIIKGHYDVVHSFGRLAYLAPLLPLRIPKVMAYQRAITLRNVVWGNRLSRSLYFTGVSEYITHPLNKKGRWRVVYNGAAISAYKPTSRVNANAPLVYLGRIEEFKGPHLAIEVARRSNRRLVLAGNIPDEPKHHKYFDDKIRPHLNGMIRYVGSVDDRQKEYLLQTSAAALMPLIGEDAFPVVIGEALACGTPVIAFNRGPFPEAVEEGVNGFLCDDIDEMVEAVNRISEIDRTECRRVMEERFSDRAIVSSYEKLYHEITGAR